MFDLQAHRGGAGLVVENTLAAFRNALAIGVSTLECDVNITADGVPVVTHDRILQATKIRDTAPVEPDDSEFPYVGRFVCRLSAAQLATLDCGSLTQPAFPGQRAVPGEPMPTFTQVLTLLDGVPDVRVNVEAKFDVLHPAETAPRQTFVDTTVGAIVDAGLTDRVSIQSFDWQALRMVGWAEPRIRRYALTNTAYLHVGQDGRSPWLGGLDIDDVGGNVVHAVAKLGFDALSPAYHPFVTPELVADANAAGILVVPYTVDEPDTLLAMIDAGVDGVITNYPDRAREAMAARGLALPAPARAT
ncbi:MAG: glycerophosphodiester phosphodiesterase [Nocardioidaceae bacterium]|nr:glycerophosphodiester phosphodiesterase [Nocardioidaceae bacterium]